MYEEIRRPKALTPEDLIPDISQNQGNTDGSNLSTILQASSLGEAPLDAFKDSAASLLGSVKLALSAEMSSFDLSGIPVSVSGKLGIGDTRDTGCLKMLVYQPVKRPQEPRRSERARGRDQFRI